MTTPWSTTKRKADAFEHRLEATCAVRVPLRHGGHLLDKGPATALRLLAAKPAYPQVNLYPATRDREIGEMTFVLAVEHC